MSFNGTVVYYLSCGCPDKIKGIRSCGIKDVYKYYLLNRVRDVNNLLDYTAYLKYLRKSKEKNAGRS